MFDTTSLVELDTCQWCQAMNLLVTILNWCRFVFGNVSEAHWRIKSSSVVAVDNCSYSIQFHGHMFPVKFSLSLKPRLFTLSKCDPVKKSQTLYRCAALRQAGFKVMSPLITACIPQAPDVLLYFCILGVSLKSLLVPVCSLRLHVSLWARWHTLCVVKAVQQTQSIAFYFKLCMQAYLTSSVFIRWNSTFLLYVNFPTVATTKIDYL